MDNQSNGQKIKDICRKLISMFESGQAPAIVARSVIKKKEGSCPSDSWSIGNRILILLADTEDARGYRQWEEVGRYVKKGAKAFYIIVPCIKVIHEAKETTDQETEHEQQVDEKKIIIRFRGVPVFRYEDTEGKPLTVSGYKPEILPPLYDVAIKMGIKVEWLPYSNKEYGYYTIDGKTIVLKSYDVPVFFHELGHAAHSQFKAQKGGQHTDQEIVAEMTAAVLAEIYGYHDYLGNCWAYIKQYSGNEPNRAIRGIMQILTDVEKCVEIILAKEKEQAA